MVVESLAPLITPCSTSPKSLKTDMMMMIVKMGCTQIPISTLAHIWVFVRLYGIVYVIIVIAIIIIMII